MYRKDYDRGEYRMISVGDPSGIRTASAAVLGSIGLLAATVLPFILGVAGSIYLIGALIVGCWMLLETIRFAMRRNNVTARRLLKASVMHIPIYVLLIVVDHFVAR